MSDDKIVKTPDAPEWQPPNDTAFGPKAERAPWGRWLVGIVILALVAGGAIWLASKVVVFCKACSAL